MSLFSRIQKPYSHRKNKNALNLLVQNFFAVHPIVVEILQFDQSGRLTDASMAKKNYSHLTIKQKIQYP